MTEYYQILFESLQREVDRLKTRQQELLVIIKRMSTESILPSEANELHAQIAALIAKVGTLRSELRTTKEAVHSYAVSGGKNTKYIGFLEKQLRSANAATVKVIEERNRLELRAREG